MRIDKLLANSTGYGRREIKQFIKKGLVSVNSKVVSDCGMHVDEIGDEVLLFGEKIVYNKYTYLMLNKPPHYISATFDKHYRVVTELVPEEFSHVELFPVGRLDIDTVGLLILTNDGDLAHRLLTPKSKVKKTYFAKLAKPIKKEDADIFAKGIKLDDDFTTLPASLCPSQNSPNEAYVTICEGKFHQVKRMFEAVDNEVIYLKRLSMGPIVLDEDLEEGRVRPLTDEEIKMLSDI